MMSGVVVWATDELKVFAAIFKKQVFQSEELFAKLGNCLKYAFKECYKLEKKGLSLSFVLARLFLPELLEVIRNNYKRVEGQIAEALAAEKWTVCELWVQDPKARKGKEKGKRKKRVLKLTDSAKYLYDIVRNLLKELVPILDSDVYPSATDELYPPVVQGMVRLFEDYLLAMAKQSRPEDVNFRDNQSLSIIANAFYLADDLLPRVSRELHKQFGRQVPELEAFRAKLLRLHDALQHAYCQKRSYVWVQTVLKLKETYGAYEGRDDILRTQPSDGFVRLCSYLTQLSSKIVECTTVTSVRPILTLATEELLRVLQDKAPWQEVNMGLGGLVQLALDLQFLIRCSGGYASPAAHEAVSMVLIRAMRAGDINEATANANIAAADLSKTVDSWITAHSFKTIGQDWDKFGESPETED